MNKIEEMTVFVRVAEAGSISRAAEQLGIAVSAVSRRLKELEKRLGAELLKRTTRSISLTDAGDEFYRHCLRIIHDLEEVEATIREGQAALKGSLNVAAPLTFGALHLAPLITRFNALHPQIQFNIDLNDRELDLVQHNIDVAIRIGVLPDSRLVAKRLFQVRVLACVSPGFIAKYGEPDSIEALRRLPLIKFNLGRGDAYYYRQRGGSLQQFLPTVAHSASDGQFICAMAEADMGYVIAPSFVISRQLASGALQPLLTDCQWGNEDYCGYIVYPATRHLSQRARALIDYIYQYFQANPDWEAACCPA